MSRVWGAINRSFAAARGRFKSVASAGFVAVAVIGVVVAMFLADGFRATTYDLNNPGVWVTNQSGGAAAKPLLGRFNTQALELDSVTLAGDAPFDVAQDGSHVAIASGAALRMVDPAAATIPTEPTAPIPDGARIALTPGPIGDDGALEGRYLVVAEDGRAWTGDAKDLGAFDQGRAEDARGAADDVVALGRDGSVAAVSKDGKVTVRSASGDTKDLELSGLAGSDGVQLGMVGDTPVVLDPGASTLHLPGSDPVDLAELGAGLQLQEPGDTGSAVAISSVKGVFAVPLGGGVPERLAGLPDKVVADENQVVRPVHINGCTYAAWTGAAPGMAVACESGQSAAGALDKPLGVKAVFRVNRADVLLNDLESGAVVVKQGDAVRRIDGDWNPKQDQTTTSTTEPDEENQVKGINLSKEQEPPTAVPDPGWGARKGRPSIVRVLDNDTDPNGDPLTVKLRSQTAGVTIVEQGRAVQVVPVDGNDVTFVYAASDGALDSKDVAVTVTVYDDDDNDDPPRLRTDVQQRDFVVELQQPGTYDVLSDWMDPQGDPLVLSGATPDDPTTARVETVPTGRLTYTANGGVPGLRNLTVHVTDVPPSGQPATGDGPLKVEVSPPATPLPPTLQADYASGKAGTDITLYPLRNDSDPNGDKLSLTRPMLPDQGWPAEVPEPKVYSEDGRLVVTPPATFKGTLLFGYEATDGTSLATAMVRVDVTANEDGGDKPSAGADLVLLPTTTGSPRFVDLLVNDYDPDGDVLMVSAVGQSSTAGLHAQLLEHRRLKVWSDNQLGAPVTLTYTLTDGWNAVSGTVVVAQSPIADFNSAPIASDDRITVRAGDVVSVDVLANDVDPDGDQLRPVPAVQGPETGRGTAFVSGSVVRFVAPTEPGTSVVRYGITDLADGSTAARASADVIIRVVAGDGNEPPTPKTVEARVLAGGTVKVVIPLSGIDADGDSVGLVGLVGDAMAEHGRILMPLGTDSITYEAFDGAGTDQFGYRVRDSRGLEGVGTVRIVIGNSEGGSPPVPGPDRIVVAPGRAVNWPVLANDYDPDDDVVRFATKERDQTQTLVDVPDGLDVEVVGTRLRITANTDQAQSFGYRVTDGHSTPPPVGSVSVQVDPNAEGMVPIARDDVAAPPADQKDLSRIAVPVLDNDEDPDGESGDPAEDLDVTVVAGDATQDGDEVVVKPGAEPQVVVYQVTDKQQKTAMAVVRVPKLDDLKDRGPVLRDASPIEVRAGTEGVPVKLADRVVDPEGKPVVLTSGGKAKLRPEALGRVDVADGDAGGFTVVADGPEALEARSRRPASVTFEVTDGGAGVANTVAFTLPVTVLPPEGRVIEPKLQPVSVTVGAGETAPPLDLARSLTPDSGSADDVEFTADTSGLPDKVTASLDDSVLTIKAAADAVLTTAPIQMPVTLTRQGAEPQTGVVSIAVVGTTRPAISCPAVVIDDAKAGEARAVELNCTNPFAEDGEDLSYGVATSSDRQVKAVTDGASLTITPAERFHGSATITYSVTDAAGRTVSGTVQVTVRDRPDAPGAPTLVSEDDQQVVLRWTAPPENGAPITKYVITAPGMNEFPCEGSFTTCTVTNLTNDRPYELSVIAVNEVGRSGPSPSTTGTPDRRPEPPTNVQLKFDPAKPDGVLTATWTASQTKGSAVDHYVVAIIPTPAGQVSTQVKGTSLELRGLENGDPYRVRVTAVNKARAGESNPTESNTERPAKLPDPVVVDDVQPISDPLGMRISVTWHAPYDGGAALTGYDVVAYQKGKCGDSTAVKTHRQATADEAGRPFELNVGDVYNEYVVGITTANKAGATAVKECSKPIQASGAPADIGQVNVTPKNSNNVGLNGVLQLSFAAPDDRGAVITRYEVEASQNGGAYQRTDRTALSAGPTIAVSGLMNGAEYRFRVRACNKNDCSRNTSPETDNERPYGPIDPPSATATNSGQDQNTVWFRVDPPPGNGRDIVRLQVDGADVAIAGADVPKTIGCGRSITITVVATDRAGQTSTRPATGGTAGCPPPPRTINIAWGQAHSVTGCTAGCKNMVASVSGFPANSSLAVRCQYRTSSTGEWKSDFGWTPPNLITDAAGNGGTGDNTSNCVGSPGSVWEYRLVIDGTNSGSYT